MIGIFDSGIGGLTVVKALTEHLPNCDMVYFGDTARTPYGTKSPGIVAEYALHDIEFLLHKGAKLIVLACNTASAAAGENIRKKFDVPVFEVISPAVEYSLRISRKFRIGVIGTRATVDSGIYEKKIRDINPEAKVYTAACPLLVPLAEEGWIKRPETNMIVRKYLHPLKVRQIDTLILGCTHYPILKKTIQRKIGQRVKLVDSSLTMAQNVKTFLEKYPEKYQMLSKNGKTEFFVSDVTEQLEKTARDILRKRVRLEHVRV